MNEVVDDETYINQMLELHIEDAVEQAIQKVDQPDESDDEVVFDEAIPAGQPDELRSGGYTRPLRSNPDERGIIRLHAKQ